MKRVHPKSECVATVSYLIYSLIYIVSKTGTVVLVFFYSVLKWPKSK